MVDGVQGILAVLTIIIGGICILLVVSTKTLRDSRDDLEFRVNQLEGERTRDKDTIASQETAIRFWRSAATGDEKLEEIAAKLDRHHQEATGQWVLMNAGLGHIGETLDSVDEHLEQIANPHGGGAK